MSKARSDWIRRRPDRKENLLALGVGLMLGAAAYYVARVLAARKPLRVAPSRDVFAHERPREREAG